MKCLLSFLYSVNGIPPNFHTQATTPNMSVLGDRASKEVVMHD